MGGARGLPGEATVLRLADGGMPPNCPEAFYRFDLEVRLPGRSKYEVAYIQNVPNLVANRLAVGDTFPIRADLQDPHFVLIDWERFCPGSVGNLVITRITIPGKDTHDR